jgi:choline dehydrogenase
MNRSYDVIVVGAGSAGCVMAARLSENPAREVALIEAGPDYPTRSTLPPEIADGTRLPTNSSQAHDWGLQSVPIRSGAPSFSLPRGRIVGGSSAVNGSFAMRGFPEDYGSWEAADNEGWGFNAVLDMFPYVNGGVTRPTRAHCLVEL